MREIGINQRSIPLACLLVITVFAVLHTWCMSTDAHVAYSSGLITGDKG